MRKNGKRWAVLALTAMMLCLLSGCMTASVEELYALPQLPEEYQGLSDQIDAILAGGAEYTSPASGANLQSVQLEDLNGDGLAEAMAFFRNNSDERPLKICIFEDVNGSYQQAAMIEGSGTSILSIRYVDMNRDGVKEILVSWRVSTEVQALAVYMLDDLQPVMLMSSVYARYEIVDLDDDDVQELLVVRSDETDAAGSVADYYDWSGQNLLLNSSARLSMSVAELQWVQTGLLKTGEAAVFVTGRVTGVEETSRAVTDILTYRQPDLTNIVLNSSTGVSSQIARFLNLQPTDINNDGATEVPMPALLPSEGEENYWKVYWFSYEDDGTALQQAITYHNQTDSWYLLIPEEWDRRFSVRQRNTSPTEHATVFCALDGRQVGEELLTIYTLTGPNRDAQAGAGERTVLRRQSNVVYAIRFGEAYDSWRWAVSEAELAQRFNPILTQWSTGEE